jgi:L-malate glycosyltransferase
LVKYENERVFVTKRARLLHVFSTFDHGGAEARTIQLMRHFGDAADHIVLIGERSATGAKAAIDPALHVAIPEKGVPKVLGHPGLLRYLRIAQYLRGFDLVLTYSWGAMDAVMAHRLFGRLFRLPPLIHHEDGIELEEQQRLRIHFRRIAMQTCSAVIVPSTGLEKTALTVWNIKQHRLARITNGIDVAQFQQQTGAGMFPGLLEQKNEVVVGTIAGLRPVKNLPLLVRAVAAAGPCIRLAIAGEGSARHEIAAEAERQGISDRLHMPGFLKDPARYLGRFDIFALSSHSEQFPIALAEAMSAGLPVIATDVGDIRSMVAPSNMPYIVPVGDSGAFAKAIAQLAADPELRSRIGRDNAERAIEEFPEDRMFARYRQVYGYAMGKPFT